jgi:hypothetical protein
MSITTTPVAVPRTEEVRHPFGLPLGTVRAVMSVAICALVWVTLLLPPSFEGVKVVLAHFFLMGLVLMAFASSTNVKEGEASPFLPWLLRVIFVGGSIAIVALCWVRDKEQLQFRLTPDIAEVKDWWIPFLATMAGGFGFGIFTRFLFGVGNHIFQTLRAWFSVVGLVLLALELAIFLAQISGQGKMIDFLHYWQCVTILIVSAYFGTRA